MRYSHGGPRVMGHLQRLDLCLHRPLPDRLLLPAGRLLRLLPRRRRPLLRVPAAAAAPEGGGGRGGGAASAARAARGGDGGGAAGLRREGPQEAAAHGHQGANLRRLPEQVCGFSDFVLLCVLVSCDLI